VTSIRMDLVLPRPSRELPQHSHFRTLNVELQDGYLFLVGDQLVVAYLSDFHRSYNIPGVSCKFSRDFRSRFQQRRAGGVPELMEVCRLLTVRKGGINNRFVVVGC
jgi:hypothetical protein